MGQGFTFRKVDVRIICIRARIIKKDEEKDQNKQQGNAVPVVEMVYEHNNSLRMVFLIVYKKRMSVRETRLICTKNI
ncbi:hypothetical protein J2S01_002564 [Pectinatus haikarae]|uniref:Uncharacterized protein n=1 Tax=Pectinatus haikarae TaxID=349096 RepID=A0ABT9YAG2_9FIRM|nr:hypothetical protein [Pectinatus haikarae]